MSRRGENIWHRKDGRWEARYIKSRVNGRAVYGYVYGKTYKEVKAKQSLKAKEIEKVKPQICTLNMNEVFDLFLKNRKHAIKESTYAKYCRDIDNHLRSYWGHIPLNDINGIMIENFTNHLLNHGNLVSGKGLSTKTVKDIIVLLKSIILYANQRELCAVNTAYIATPKTKKNNIQTLSKKEQEILENYLRTDINLIKLGILLTLYTGLRIGELCALQWKDIDIKNHILHIERTIQRISDTDEKNSTKIIFDTPKSESSIRNIPIFTGVFRYLMNLFCEEKKSGESFFLTGDESYIEPRNMYRQYKNCLSECGLPPYTFHCLRHTFATRAIECGFDPKSLSEILGHSNVKITLDRYVHPDLELKKSYVELLSKVANF